MRQTFGVIALGDVAGCTRYKFEYDTIEIIRLCLFPNGNLYCKLCLHGADWLFGVLPLYGMSLEFRIKRTYNEEIKLREFGIDSSLSAIVLRGL